MAKRVAIVTLIALLSLFVWAPDLGRVFGHPLAVMGVSLSADGVVQAVDPREAASGVRAGDRFDLSRANMDQHWTYVLMRGVILPPFDPGMRYTVPMLRNGTPYIATVVPYPENAYDAPAVLLRAAIEAVAMLLGIVVLLRRPSAATWAFFTMVCCGCAAANVSAFYGPEWWRSIVLVVYWLVGWNALGAWASIVFAVYLLHDGPLPRWRRLVLAVAIALALVNCVLAVSEATTILFASRPYPAIAIAFSSLYVIPYLAAPAVLIATYFESSPNVRERLRWIIAGFVLAAVCMAVDQSSSQGNLALFQSSYVVHSLLVAGAYLFIAVPVAYAVLKHHIIDVNVALSRATVYTALSVIVVGVFALVDLFFTQALDQKSAGLIADIGLALVLGFSFNTMHRHVDAFVDRVLFRKRHLAEEYLRRLAASMVHARTEAQVRAMLTSEPMRALDLSAARIVPCSGSDEQMQMLGSYVETHGSVRLGDRQWKLDAAVAVPVFSHGTLSEIALYGVHANGTDLDAEEVQLLERLAANAGAALDRLEAEELRAENALLQQKELVLSEVIDKLGGVPQRG